MLEHISFLVKYVEKHVELEGFPVEKAVGSVVRSVKFFQTIFFTKCLILAVLP